MLQAAGNQPIHELLGDKGYDAEHNHRLCREELGIASTIIPARRNVNGTRQWPSTPYRRGMKLRSAREGYGQRWQVESAISRHKRIFGSSLRARTWGMQKGECGLRTLTHNLMLLAALSCFLRSRTAPSAIVDGPPRGLTLALEIALLGIYDPD
jgi:hypothetical protein